MTHPRKLHIAVAGLGFGAEFVPIYLDHPNVASVTICDPDEERLRRVGERFSIHRRVREVQEVTESSEIDAVHLVTGIPDHASMAIHALEAGKHCACTVPPATSLDELDAVVAAQKRSGKNYMMMETAVYTRQFLYARSLLEQGAFGRIQFLRGALYNDMEGWPPYWAGYPPLWYPTHALGPLLAIAGARAVKVHCFGSGEMREELRAQYANPYPVETAIFQLDKPGLAAEVTMALFQFARPYIESFVIYGENACYEWQMEDEPPVLFRTPPVVPGRPRQAAVEHPEPPDRNELLPERIRRYTRRFVYGTDERQMPFEQGGGHHGSHPYLVDEFVRSILEERPPAIDAATAANWTAPGICAHQSAMQGGKEVVIPGWE
jgi:predicted dehydrogenase